MHKYNKCGDRIEAILKGHAGDEVHGNVCLCAWGAESCCVDFLCVGESRDITAVSFDRFAKVGPPTLGWPASG